MVRHLGLISILMLSACAQVGVPTGGEKDNQPPVVINAEPELGATEVSTKAGGTITLEFDEYVNVRQLSAQLLVSPPLKKPVEWWMKGREVTFMWNEDLEEGGTYVFQFGEAIIDVREGNAASNLLHAFSTGPSIDTLSLHGKVVDAFTQEAQADRKIFLYERSTPIDSIVAGELPKYVGNTNSKGEFTLKYLGEGEYRLLAIDDVDRNYRWTDGEALALYSERIKVSGCDTLTSALRMQKTANTEVKYFVNTKRDSLGLIKIEMSAELEDLTDINAHESNALLEEKTLWVWNNESEIEQSTVVWVGADTLVVSEIMASSAEELSVSGPTGQIISGTEILLRLNRPIISVTDSLFRAMRSDSSNVELEIHTLENDFELMVAGKFGRGNTLNLEILPGAVTGWGDMQLKDTTEFKWSTFESTDLAELSVNIDKNGWLELVSANGTVVDAVVLTGAANTVLFKNLTPGSYALRWLGDENLNGEWDGVSIKHWREPESAIVLPANIKVKADWSHTLDWE